MSTNDHLELVLRDKQLADRCLDGQSQAWSELYHQCHDKLLSAIRDSLGYEKRQHDSVEEIAALVWYRLVKNDARLLSQFEVSHGCRLVTFVIAVAHHEILTYLRSERRRINREYYGGWMMLTNRQTENPAFFTMVEEILDSLTPGERMFLKDVQLAPIGEEQDARYSRTNIWQIRHRLAKKIRAFFATEND